MTEGTIFEEAKRMSTKEKEKLAEKIAEDASHYEMTIRGCCQCVLAAIHDNLKIGGMELYKAASPMSAGVAGNGEVCGALVAGVLSIGLVYGRDNKEEITTYSKSYQDARDRAGRLTDKFRAEFGSLRCNDILAKLHGRSFNLRDPEDRKALSVPDIHDKCAYITCKKAARMAVEVLLEAGEPSDFLPEAKK